MAFEPTKEVEEKYKVKSPKLISEGLNIDFYQYKISIALIR
ncbi:hypothetical protein [Borreliella burgdorferi]